ncbi:cyclin-O isoform X2 [Myripristis murdjan]|uniref:cyclin-O isoform X2 n=1 Tax=Myripristis murdjan TaxID=586833 RepID=UPI00117622BD|nr:cyclin-O isoform X2 [Myripristis murdjan]
MVSFVNGDGGSEALYKRRRTSSASPPTQARTPVQQQQQQQTTRHRKQKLMSRLSDSGFEEDLWSPVASPPVRTAVPPPRTSEKDEAAVGELAHWYCHYGDIGYRIQKEKEAQFHPCTCLARQPQVTAEARCKLVSWLIAVHKHFRLSFECCCLAVNIMDRFLASTPVATDCFQLLGVEVFSPQISQLLSLCCDSFTKEQLCNLECLILLRLNFRLAAPTLAFFLDYYTNCMEAAQLVASSAGGDRSARGNPDTQRPTQCSNLARRVCELSLADYTFNKYPPSLTAGCALRIASELLKPEEPADLSETHAPSVINSQEDHCDTFIIELFDKSQSLTDSASAQSLESLQPSEKGSAAHVRLVVQDSHSCSLAQECIENLKLLVSLNEETLQEMQTT